MAIFVAIIFVVPIALVELVGWQYAVAFWAVLFLGTGLLKLLGLGF